ncbi:MAG: hypothetical protein HUK26_05505, partial [Duodenibacillus sp.]|nr:hypothetical protein [Duodenibacillus sp.]
MTQCYVLLPGLLPPAGARSEVTASALAAAGKLSARLSDAPTAQRYGAGVFTGALHEIWAWSVLARKPLPAASAPFAWLEDLGPELATQVWRLTLFAEGGRGLEPARLPLPEGVRDALYARLARAFDACGCVIQRWDDAFWVTRKRPWRIAARPWRTFAGRAADPAADTEAAGEDAARSAADLEEARGLLARIPALLAQGGPCRDGLGRA